MGQLLIVDDDLSIRELMKLYLKNLIHESDIKKSYCK